MRRIFMINFLFTYFPLLYFGGNIINSLQSNVLVFYSLLWHMTKLMFSVLLATLCSVTLELGPANISLVIALTDQRLP